MAKDAVEVVRGGRVESRHRVAACVVDAKGRLRLGTGDLDWVIYPRSALKPFQALPLLETGAADAFALGEEELALACASHSGEPVHVGRVANWLAHLGLEPHHLVCGPHPPTDSAAHAALIERGERPSRLHNNCSGKHAGMLTACVHKGWHFRGYDGLQHPVQRYATAALAELAGLQSIEAPGRDGCSLPAFMLPLRSLAQLAARLADPTGLAPEREEALRRVGRAMRAHPRLVAGSGRLCTNLMRAVPDLIVKTGAEGVYMAASPTTGFGIALKAVDGAGRAAEVALLSLLDHLGLIPDSAKGELRAHAQPPLHDWNGNEVGEIRPLRGWLA